MTTATVERRWLFDLDAPGWQLPVVTVREAADLLNLSPDAIRNLIHSGALTGHPSMDGLLVPLHQVTGDPAPEPPAYGFDGMWWR